MESILPVITSFFACFAVVRLGKPVAIKIGLVDRPGGRKQHDGVIPLVGGIAIFIAVAFSTLLLVPIKDATLLFYILSAALMLMVGVLDDKYDLSVSYRIAAQIFAACLMIFGADLHLNTLGHLLGGSLGLEELKLGWFGPALTIIAVVGAINAFNMVDGIDGLAGMLSIISFSAIAILMAAVGHPWFVLPLCFIAAICAYLMFNLGIPKGRLRKVFMGDAGSMVIGLTMVWLLLLGSQPSGYHQEVAFAPVIALWIIAIPLMDMAAIMYRRKKKGQSPFKPDRDHLHHIFMRAGFSPRQTLALICFLNLLIAGFGIAGQRLGLSETWMLVLFLLLFVGYTASIQYAWRLVKALRGMTQQTGRVDREVETNPSIDECL